MCQSSLTDKRGDGVGGGDMLEVNGLEVGRRREGEGRGGGHIPHRASDKLPPGGPPSSLSSP